MIHTSLLEGLIIKKSNKEIPHEVLKCTTCGHQKKFRTFREALKVLEKEIGKNEDLLHKIYNARNTLAHDFVTLTQVEIEANIEELWKNILQSYTADFVNELFQEYYQIQPKMIVEARPYEELQQDT